MSSPQNQAAYLVTEKQRPFEVRPAPLPTPGPNEIVIRVRAVAINPVDCFIQDAGFIVQSYPAILGVDMAGEVHAVGTSVTAFKPGDRVAGYADGIMQGKFTNTAFQHFAATKNNMVTKIPDNVDFADACVLPLCLATAAAGLYEKDNLALELPTAEKKPRKDEWVFVYGGSSSVGSCATMMAKASGYRVAVAAGPKNAEYVKALGADEVFDSYDEKLVDEVVKRMKGRHLAGVFDAIGEAFKPGVGGKDIIAKLADIALKAEGTKKLSTVNIRCDPADIVEGVVFSHTYGATLETNELGAAIFHDFAIPALNNAALQCKPSPLIVGKGLDKIQSAFDRLKAGVSAQKVVVEI